MRDWDYGFLDYELGTRDVVAYKSSDEEQRQGRSEVRIQVDAIALRAASVPGDTPVYQVIEDAGPNPDITSPLSKGGAPATARNHASWVLVL